VGDVNDVVESAIGGKTVTTTVEGRERYPVSVRYARDFRDDSTRSNVCSFRHRRERKSRSQCWPTSITKRAAIDSKRKWAARRFRFRGHHDKRYRRLRAQRVAELSQSIQFPPGYDDSVQQRIGDTRIGLPLM